MKIIVDNQGEAPEIGAFYWTFYYNERTEFTQVLETAWRGDMVDHQRYREGRIFKNKRLANDGLQKKIDREYGQ